MTSSAERSGVGPVSQDARIDAIDVLRGFALLGILVINIQFFAMPDVASANPTAYGDLHGANFYVWLGSRMLALQRFMTIFSMLFGAGIVLMAMRAEARGDSRRFHYRRMAWLTLIGLLHAHLLWAGDILFSYGVCGMLVYPLRKQSPARLLVLGASLIAVPSVVLGVLGASMPYWPPEMLAAITAEAWQPSQTAIDEFLTAYRGGWLAQAPFRSLTAIGFQTLGLFLLVGWRVCGLMLVGMALFKLDVFSAGRSRRYYAMLVAVGLFVGLPVEAYGVMLDFEYGWATEWSMVHGLQFNYWPSIAVSLGYVGLVMLACQSAALRRITRPFAAVGQTALTNYLVQTVICTTIFYGHGFGYYGSVDRLGQLGVVIGVWVVQLIASPLWLQRYRFGPAEWVWRSLTYGTRPPLRRTLEPAP